MTTSLEYKLAKLKSKTRSTNSCALLPEAEVQLFLINFIFPVYLLDSWS